LKCIPTLFVALIESLFLRDTFQCLYKKDSSGIPVDRFCYFLSFRLVRNLSGDVFIIQVLHQGIPLPDKLYLVLSAHILYLFFSDYGTPAVTTKLVINKFMQVILCCEAMRIEVVLMFMYSSYEVIRHPNIQRRSCIGHNMHSKNTLHHSAIISERFRTSRNDIHTKAKKAIKRMNNPAKCNRHLKVLLRD
jgi:hypothetical protein